MFNHKILALYDPGRDWPSFFRMSVLIQVDSAWGITKENSCISLRRFAVSHHPYDSIQNKANTRKAPLSSTGSEGNVTPSPCPTWLFCKFISSMGHRGPLFPLGALQCLVDSCVPCPLWALSLLFEVFLSPCLSCSNPGISRRWEERSMGWLRFQGSCGQGS